jgi:N-acetylneuraminate lyase
MPNPRCLPGGPLHGLIAATFTPLTADGAIHLSAIPEIVEHLANCQVAGMYVLGSTGEGVSLTCEERQQVAEAFVAASAGQMPVIVQVGCESLSQARQLAIHAQRVGADAISAVSPVYFKPQSVEALIDSMAEIAGGAPELPFYYYHIPAVTGVTHNMLDFLRMGGPQIPTLAGIKFTSTDVEAYRTCVQFAAEEYQVLWGVDELLFDGLQAGAQAAVGSTYNFAAPIYHRLRAAFARGDFPEARAQQQFAQAIVDAFVPYGPRAAQKAIMAMVGPDCGPCRLPLKSLTTSQVRSLRDDLQAIGFFENSVNPKARLTA